MKRLIVLGISILVLGGVSGISFAQPPTAVVVGSTGYKVCGYDVYATPNNNQIYALPGSAVATSGVLVYQGILGHEHMALDLSPNAR